MKRPLLWIMIAYVLGIVSYKAQYAILIPMILVSYAMLVLFFQSELWRMKKEKNLSLILVILPLLFLLGHSRMNAQIKCADIETIIDKKMNATILGQIEGIQCYETSNALILKDVKIQLETSKDIYECKKVIVYVPIETIVQYGNILSVQGYVYPLTRASNPGQFDQFIFYKAKDIAVRVYANEVKVLDKKTDSIKQTLFHLKEKLKTSYKTILPKKEAGVLSAMLLGDKAMLEEDIQEKYQENGISHIISISGLHMSFFGLSIYQLLRKLKCRITISTMVVFVMILLYGILTNNSVSANRAICMLILLLLATIFGKTYDALSALSFSALIALIKAPMQLYQVSFLLSYGAILGISILYPIFKERGFISSKPILKNITEGIFLSLSVQIITFPIVLFFFFETSSYSFLINLIVVPLLSILFPMAVLGGILFFISTASAHICIGASYYILILYEKLCDGMQKLPYSLYLYGKPSMFQILSFYCIVVVIVYLAHRTKLKWIATLFLLCPLLFLIQKNEFQITMLDVSQGECIVIQNENGNVYMIDGGSTDVKDVGGKRMIPYLKSLGVNNITCAFLTHSDTDHISGIMEILTSMEDGEKGVKRRYQGDIFIESICLPELVEYNDKYKEIIQLARNKGVQVRYYKRGESLQDGELKLYCLSPELGMDLSDVNSHSLVFWLNYGEFDALFTGDIDAAVELRVLRELNQTKTAMQDQKKTQELSQQHTQFEVLKVSHHGSKYSSNQEFLTELKPLHSIISCGKHNRYGHPHEEAIVNLEKVGTRIHKTSTEGAITIITDGISMKVKHFITGNQ